MNINDDIYKDIVLSSSTETLQFKKIYVLSLHDDTNHLLENIPYTHVISDRSIFNINNIKYYIPKLIKHLALLDKKTNKLIINDNILLYVDQYITYLSKIERLLFILRTDINNLDFYMLRKTTKMIDILDLILFEFKNSLDFFDNHEYVIKYNNIKDILYNIRDMLSTKVQYLDILNSRALNIVTLTSLPILVLMTMWNVSINKKDSILYYKYYKYAYRLTYIICFIIMFYILFKYKKDFY